MKQNAGWLTIAAVVLASMMIGCTSSKPTVAVANGTGGTGGNPDASESETIGTFSVSLISAAVEGGTNVAYTDATGHVFDAPQLETLVETPLPLPDDATEGCAVYAVASYDCSAIGGCGVASGNAACAQAAMTGVNPCSCVGTDTCQPAPSLKDVGTVTVRGVKTADGATAFELSNVQNAYSVNLSTTQLTYPGFDEGATISVSATGGDYQPFTITAPGVAPLQLTSEDISIVRDSTSSDPTKYAALALEWNAPQAGSTATMEIELNLSRHGGNLGYVICSVPDTGSLTISSGLMTQLTSLGVAGFPEVMFTRSTTGSTTIAQGSIDLVVQSYREVFATVEGYITCGTVDRPCPTGMVCNTANKVCVNN